jgi:hypothetical protein
VYYIIAVQNIYISPRQHYHVYTVKHPTQYLLYPSASTSCKKQIHPTQYLLYPQLLPAVKTDTPHPVSPLPFSFYQLLKQKHPTQYLLYPSASTSCKNRHTQPSISFTLQLLLAVKTDTPNPVSPLPFSFYQL